MKEKLRRYYQTAYATLPGLLAQPDQAIADCYVHLAIVEQASQMKKEQAVDDLEQTAHPASKSMVAPGPSSAENQQVAETLRNERLRTYEDIYHPVKPIAIEALFSPDAAKQEFTPIQRILVIGRAGVGKSTLCQYLAYQWATEGLWSEQFETLYWVRLKEFMAVVDESSTQDLADVFYRYFDRDPKNTNLCRLSLDALQADLEANKPLLILDGFDEVAQHYEERSEQGKLLRSLLAYSRIILTTRPYGVPPPAVKFDRCLENLGFSNEQIERYIRNMARNYEQEEEKAGQFCQLLKANPNLWGIAHIPINLNLLCQLHFLAEGSFAFSDTVTLTQIYSAMGERLLRHYAIEKKGLDKEAALERSLPELITLCETEIRFLEALAFEGLKTGRLLIDRRTVNFVKSRLSKQEKASILASALRTGFLKDIGLAKHQKTYYFIHLTFQEYLAAQYLVRGLNEADIAGEYFQEVLEFIGEEKYRPEYRILFQFTAGLLSQAGVAILSSQQAIANDEGSSSGITATAQVPFSAALAYFWDELLCSAQDLIGLQKVDLWLTCLEEARLPGRQEIDGRLVHVDYMVEELKCWMKRGLKSRDLSLFTNVEHLLVRHPSSWGLLLLCHELRSMMRNKYSEVRSTAQKALGVLCDQASSAVLLDVELMECLKAGLRDEEWGVRSTAQDVLGVLCNQASSAVLSDVELMKCLKAGLRDESVWVRCAAQKTIGILCNQALSAVLSDVELMECLKAGLRDEDEWVRSAAQDVLGVLCNQASLVVLSDSELMEWLKANLRVENVIVRSTAQKALGILCNQASSAVLSDAGFMEWLKVSLRDEAWGVRSTAQKALNILCNQASSAVLADVGFREWLKAVLRDKDGRMRTAAQAALGALCNQATSAVLSDVGFMEWLKAVLRDEDVRVRSAAQDVLVALCDQASSAVLADVELMECLKAGLRDEDKWVRSAAQVVLRVLCNQASLAVLSDVELKECLKAGLRDEDEVVRSAAQVGLGVLCNQALSAMLSDVGFIGWLKVSLRDKDGRVRNTAQATLGVLCNQASSAVLSDVELMECLKAGLRDEKEQVRSTAQKALGILCNQASSAVLSDVELMESLKASLRDKDWWVRSAAQKVLVALCDQASSAVLSDEGLKECLKVGLRDEYECVRSAAQAVLGVLCDQASSAVLSDVELKECLKNGLRDEDEWVRRAAQKGLIALCDQASSLVLSDVELMECLKAGLRDEKWGGREEVAQAALVALCSQASLAVLADAGLMDWLKASVRDEDARVRAAAEEALIALCGQASLAVLADEALISVLGVLWDYPQYRRLPENLKRGFSLLVSKLTAPHCLAVSPAILASYIKGFFRTETSVYLLVTTDKLVLQINQQPPTIAYATTEETCSRLQAILQRCEAQAEALRLPLTVYKALHEGRSVVPRMLPRPARRDTYAVAQQAYAESQQRDMALREQYSLTDNHLPISHTNWVVSLMRKPLGRNPEHAFLIVEGRTQFGRGVLHKIELVLDETRPQRRLPKLGVISGYGKVLIKSQGAIALEKLKEVFYGDDFLKGSSFLPKSFSITAHQKDQLLQWADEEHQREGSAEQVSYFLGGASRLTSLNNGASKKSHNCFTWAVALLNRLEEHKPERERRIKIELDYSVYARTSNYLRNPYEEKSERNCLAM